MEDYALITEYRETSRALNSQVSSTEYKSTVVLYRVTFLYRYRYRRYFFKNLFEVLVLRYFFKKSIRYFQFFVFTYRLKIKLSLSLWSGVKKNLTPKYTVRSKERFKLQSMVIFTTGLGTRDSNSAAYAAARCC